MKTALLIIGGLLVVGVGGYFLISKTSGTSNPIDSTKGPQLPTGNVQVNAPDTGNPYITGAVSVLNTGLSNFDKISEGLGNLLN